MEFSEATTMKGLADWSDWLAPQVIKIYFCHEYDSLIFSYVIRGGLNVFLMYFFNLKNLISD
jgi:hypothetical protein